MVGASSGIIATMAARSEISQDDVTEITSCDFTVACLPVSARWVCAVGAIQKKHVS